MNFIKNLLIGLIGIAPALVHSGCQAPQANQIELPNVVLIMADDMGYETLGCNGSLEYTTPNLDKLANIGVRFERCYSQPLCTPSRVKIMTGKYNYRNYVDFEYLSPDQKTFGNLLKDAGYSTCIAGKWQLNGIFHNYPGNQDVTRPNHFGFDEYCLWQLHHRRTPQDERYANPLLTQNGKDLPRNENGYGPQIISDFLQDFIDRNSENPFFIYYPMVLPHDPFVPTPDSPEWEDPTHRYEHDTIYFDDMIAYVDKIIGQIEAKLKVHGLWENTLFIFTADNGTHPSVLTHTNKGIIKGAKGSTLNTGNHVPMIVSWPEKIKRNKVFHGVIDFTDILPTIADAAGIDPASYFTDGKSFINVLEGDNKRINKNEVFIHYTPRWGRFIHDRWVMDGEYKLYQDGRFYNTLNDPDENSEKEILTVQEKGIKQKFEKILSQKENEFPFKWNDEEFNPQK
jgi:arylsulfatase A